VIRLGPGQGRWRSFKRTRPGGREADPRRTWREVLDVFLDRGTLEAEFGNWQVDCTQPGCSAKQHDGAWQAPLGTELQDDHEHHPSGRGGRLEGELAWLAEQAWDESESSIVVRVVIQEFSDPSEIEDLFILMNRYDLVEAQSLPAAGYEDTWPSRCPGLDPGMLRTLVSAAGDLWNSTSGRDPYDVLSVRQREALDLAGEITSAASEE